MITRILPGLGLLPSDSLNRRQSRAFTNETERGQHTHTHIGEQRQTITELMNPELPLPKIPKVLPGGELKNPELPLPKIPKFKVLPGGELKNPELPLPKIPKLNH